MKLIRNLFWTYLILLPLMNLPRPFSWDGKVQYCDIVFVFLLISWYAYIVRSKNMPSFPKQISVSLILLVIANLFSWIYSQNPAKSFADFLGVLYLVTLFLAFTSLFQERGLFKSGINIIFFASVLTSLIGIISLAFFRIGNYAWTKFFLLFTEPLKSSLVPFQRIKSTLLLPEMFIAFSQLGLVCGMISLDLEGSAFRKKIRLIGIFAVILAAIFSYSRSLAGFFLPLSAMVLLKKNFPFRIPIKITVILLFLILLTFAVITSVWVVYPITLNKDAQDQTIQVSFYTSPDIRATLRKAAFTIALKNPLWGIGQGMFTYEVKKYITPGDLRNTIYKDKASLEIDPHCAYTGSMAETGFLGLGAILLFFYFLIKVSLGGIKKSVPQPYRNAGIYLLAGFTGYLLNSCFMDVFSLRQFWIIAALSLGITSIAKRHEEYC